MKTICNNEKLMSATGVVLKMADGVATVEGLPNALAGNTNSMEKLSGREATPRKAKNAIPLRLLASAVTIYDAKTGGSLALIWKPDLPLGDTQWVYQTIWWTRELMMKAIRAGDKTLAMKAFRFMCSELGVHLLNSPIPGAWVEDTTYGDLLGWLRGDGFQRPVNAPSAIKAVAAILCNLREAGCMYMTA